METTDFVRDKLTEWGLSEFIQRFKDGGIDKETFLSLGDSDSVKVLIPKIGPRVKFKKRLKQYLETERCDFVQDKLTEWDLSELIDRFEEEGIDKETFLSLEESGIINDLIPKAGPRVKFRKRLREYLQALKRRKDDTPEIIDISSEEEDSLEIDPLICPWLLESTSASDTDSGNEKSEEPIYPGATVTRGQGLIAVILYILRYQLTAAMQGGLMSLLNLLIPDLVVEFKYLPFKIPLVSTVFYCEMCQNYLGKNPDASCRHCGEVFDKARSIRKGKFFLSAALKDLLRDILKYHGTKLLPETVKHDIKDVVDGKMYQTRLQQGQLAKADLTLSWNCDGVPIFESTRYSIWPLQFTINELPYTQRIENVIVAGLWFGPEKPEMNTFLKPFLDECQDLAQNPFQWSDSNGTVHSSKVFSLVCSSDAVARPLLRNCNQFNGEYGCEWCLHPGAMVKKGKGSMRSYPYDEMKQEARSNRMFVENAREAENSETPKNGVKGLSLLSKLPLFDIVFGFVPEYLHSVLLGVSKQLVSLWLKPNSSTKAWYVGDQISEMDSRLLRLKPPSEISRSPRSLKCFDFWKASEWRAFLLFYAISVLPGILHPSFLEHYLCLSLSIHILLQESISQTNLQLAHQYLVRFVVDMKELYGEENVTFNCHQLIHLTESVQNWGPLWATSAFSFERNNGHLRFLLQGREYNPQHICQRFLLLQRIPRHLDSLVFNKASDFGDLLVKVSPVNDGNGSQKSLEKSQHLDLTGAMKLAVEQLLNRPVLVKSVEAVDRFTHRNTVYQTTNCKESDNRDCVIKLRNGCCGEVQWKLLIKETCVCASNCLCQALQIIVVHLYDITPAAVFSKISCDEAFGTFFMRAEKTNELKAFFLEDIRCKCMYMDGWLVPLPNSYERY